MKGFNFSLPCRCQEEWIRTERAESARGYSKWLWESSACQTILHRAEALRRRADVCFSTPAIYLHLTRLQDAIRRNQVELARRGPVNNVVTAQPQCNDTKENSELGTPNQSRQNPNSTASGSPSNGHRNGGAPSSTFTEFESDPRSTDTEFPTSVAVENPSSGKAIESVAYAKGDLPSQTMVLVHVTLFQK